MADVVLKRHCKLLSFFYNNDSYNHADSDLKYQELLNATNFDFFGLTGENYFYGDSCWAELRDS